MRSAVAAGLAIVLAGCSGSNAPAATDNARSDASAATAPTSTPIGNAPVAGVRAGGLTAQVSALSADVSGLNTRITDMGLVIDLPADALFDFDKATLTDAAEGELRKAAEVIRASPPGPIRIVGHTDAKGEDAYNLRLSQARAQTVADWFGQQVGVRRRTFEVSGKGETMPVAPNARPGGGDDAVGRAKNRRVEVVVPHVG